MTYTVFVFPFLQLSILDEDKKFAREICKGNKHALSQFLERFSDEVYYVASKFNNRGIPQESWEYRTKTGYAIHVTDDVSDTYLWLVRIAQKKSCLYRGDKGATFSTYIIAVLNSEFTFKDWLKWKTGVTGYVPKCIMELGDEHRQVYKLLRHNKTDHQICSTLEMELSDYYSIYRNIEDELIKSNQLDLLQKPKFFSSDYTDDDDQSEIQLINQDQLKTEDQPDFNIVKNIAETVIKELSHPERRLILLYWGVKQSVDEIFNTFSVAQFKQYLNNLSIRQPSDIYRNIEQIVMKCFNAAKDIFPGEVSEYGLNPKNMKTLLRNYLHNFDFTE